MADALLNEVAELPRIERVQSLKIEFIASDDFQSAEDLSNPLVDKALQSDDADAKSTAPDGMPAHLRRMCESNLLSFESEQALFRAMNYRKFRAHELRAKLDTSSPDPQQIAKIEQLLREATTLRDHVIKANMRLVISIAKKFVTNQNNFDEMLSDGLVALMNCVDKFDYVRGFRFSTYAYRSIARELYRSAKSSKLRSSHLAKDGEEWVLDPEDVRRSSAARDSFWGNLRERTTSMLSHLDRRERMIIRCRYALGSHRKVKSLQFLADRLGVSKERVRQLEIRAMGKLRKLAADVEIDDIVGSALS